MGEQSAYIEAFHVEAPHSRLSRETSIRRALGRCFEAFQDLQVFIGGQVADFKLYLETLRASEYLHTV